jgi:excisionase family DNA binding protein
MNDKIYTLQELAKRWSCSMSVMYDMVRSHKITAFQVGKQYRVRADEVARYEAEDARKERRDASR